MWWLLLLLLLPLFGLYLRSDKEPNDIIRLNETKSQFPWFMSFHYISPHSTYSTRKCWRKISREQFDVHLHTSCHRVSQNPNENRRESVKNELPQWKKKMNRTNNALSQCEWVVGKLHADIVHVRKNFYTYFIRNISVFTYKYTRAHLIHIWMCESLIRKQNVFPFVYIAVTVVFLVVVVIFATTSTSVSQYHHSSIVAISSAVFHTHSLSFSVS